MLAAIAVLQAPIGKNRMLPRGHVRFDDRTDADGKRTLHVAEIQSDLHQRGRRTGYRDDKFKAEAEKRLDEIYAEKNALAADRDEATNRMRDEPDGTLLRGNRRNWSTNTIAASTTPSRRRHSKLPGPNSR